MRYKFDHIDHARIFGPRDDLSRPGTRQYRCRYCKGWHVVGETPDNCKSEAPPRNPVLKAPMIVPDIPPHTHAGQVIGSRSEQREFLARSEGRIVEHDDFKETAGTHKLADEMNTKTYEQELAKDIIRAIEEDPLNRPPPTLIDEANHRVADEEKIDTTLIEVPDANSATKDI